MSELRACAKCGKMFGPNLRNKGYFDRGLQRFCSRPCSYGHSKFSPEQAAEVFWSRVNKNGPNGCWVYTGGCDAKYGYGRISFLGRHHEAHRLSWKLLRGDPGTLDVLHKCNNPPCCNPDHLYLGDDFDNAQDRIKAGTLRAKVTPDQVREIRSLIGTKPLQEIDDQLGVCRGTSSRIKLGKAFTWVQ